jgi:hypothetical protein
MPVCNFGLPKDEPKMLVLACSVDARGAFSRRRASRCAPKTVILPSAELNASFFYGSVPVSGASESTGGSLKRLKAG